MARLDVHPMPGKAREGYLVDVQADLLFQLNTRTGVPLVPEHATSKPMRELNPVFDVAGRPHIMLTQAIATIPARELKPAICSLTSQHHLVTRSLDILLIGH